MPDAERLLKFSFYNYFCMAYSKLCVFNSASLFSNRKTGSEALFHLQCHKKVFFSLSANLVLCLYSQV